ncbi:MAG: DNA mismatch repair protein MutS [Bacteroidia bacterium]|nr:DNA mismatch repair protein MutS [Bacteroidia bacterium]
MLCIFTAMKNRSMIKSATADKETPLMKQYNTIKAKYPDALLLFRVGDFYETFGEDAKKASGILGIVLTRRANGAASFVELAGFPHHSLETYLPKLVRAGQRVAICDQLEDPKLTKTIVKRGVTELVTPGVVFSENILENKSNNFLCAIHFGDKISGIAFLDISTGEFLVAEGNLAHIDKLIQSFRPSEIIFQKNKLKVFTENFGDKFYTFKFDDWVFTPEFTGELLLRHFETKSLKGFGIENMEAACIAAGAALHYLYDTQHDKIKHLSHIARIEDDKFVWLDRFTLRNLEILAPANDKGISLINVLDKTISPMGGRLLKRWLAMPLKNKVAIDERLSSVDYFLAQEELSNELRKNIRLIGDLERIISRVAAGRVSPRDVVQLGKALRAIEPVKIICENSSNPALNKIAEQLNPCKLITEKIEKELNPEAPFIIQKGNVINAGVSDELDALRKIAFSGKDYLLEIQKREVERTGITSLKVAFNNVFGYYLEVTNAHKNKVPADWMRKQTLTNAERYITPELKEYEEKILGAEEKIQAHEIRLFNELVVAVADYISPVQLNAALISRLDCLLCFATVSEQNNYVKPEITDDNILNIKDGRHPVIERVMPAGEQYIANDIYLDSNTQQIIIITGPNMAGKSALLRQTALIVIMAQAGCFVPAKAALIGLADKIFTRVGASDNISSGESTFMVEMNETASILNNVSEKSLIILDEIGRGTSTYDGISIAHAIVEFLHENKTSRARTLFATHYHELNEITKTMQRVKNFNVSVKEAGNKVIFMRKLVAGGSEHSFGIHVAKMAGMPKKVVERANEIMLLLEKSHEGEIVQVKSKKTEREDYQLSFFQLDDPVLSQIKEDILNTDINTLTPVEALLKLNEIKKLIGG